MLAGPLANALDRRETLISLAIPFHHLPPGVDTVTTILQAVLCDDPMPIGVAGEIVRLHRKPVARRLEPALAGLLNAWAVTAGHIRGEPLDHGS